MNRRLRNSAIALCALVVAVVIGSAAASPRRNARGSAIIPHWRAQVFTSQINVETKIFVSNVTDAAVSVDLYLYRSDGTAFYDGDGSTTSGEIQLATAWSDVDTWVEGVAGDPDDPPTLKITLNPSQTVFLSIQGPQTAGYGRIVWEQTESRANSALVAYGYVKDLKQESDRGRISQYSIVVNDGKRF